MKLHITSKEKSRLKIRAILQHDGWKVHLTPGRSLVAEHAEVHDGASARHRLYRVGLLTSSAVRIDFLPGEAIHRQ
jgi:hypothetical protein